jgi:hypothetical protein
LNANRAILVAQSPAKRPDGAALLRDDRPLGGAQNRHVTMYRFVFPVKKEKSG